MLELITVIDILHYYHGKLILLTVSGQMEVFRLQILPVLQRRKGNWDNLGILFHISA